MMTRIQFKRPMIDIVIGMKCHNGYSDEHRLTLWAKWLVYVNEKLNQQCAGAGFTISAAEAMFDGCSNVFYLSSTTHSRLMHMHAKGAPVKLVSPPPSPLSHVLVCTCLDVL